MALSADSQMLVVRRRHDAVDQVGASRLRLSDDPVATASFVRLHGGQPFSYTRVCLPPPIGVLLGGQPQLATEGATSQVTVIGLLDHRLPSAIREAQHCLSVVPRRLRPPRVWA